jgi:outer membrane receptor protein involved in Fe transport
MSYTFIQRCPADSESLRTLPLAAAIAAALIVGGFDPPAALAGQAQQAIAPAVTGTANPVSAAKTPDAQATPSDDERSRLVYSVNRTPERPFDTTRAVQVITAEDIWRQNARTVPELLMNETGIFVQQTNYGGGSPIVRGLMGKQIVILLDGVRINNATFRFGPLQYLNTIDISAVERIEIVRGVESVLGSDSLGGLINIILKKGPPAGTNQAIGGTVSTRLSSGDAGGAGHAEVYGRIDKLRYSFGTTYRRAGDVQPGDNRPAQRLTGYDEGAAAMSAEYAVSPARTLSLRYHTLTQDKVPGASAGATTTYLVNDPQKLHLLTLEYQDLTKHRLFDQLQVTGYVNRQDEGQIEIRSTAINVERRNLDSDDVVGASLQMASFLGGSHRLIYGFDYTNERIDSVRNDVNVVTGAVAVARGKFTDNARYETAALYVQDHFDITKWLTPSIGARYGRTSASGSENSKVAVLDLASTQTGLTGSAGVVGHLSHLVNIVASVTRGFRPPNIDDLSRYDDRSGSEGIEIPNPGLRPERSLTYEIGVKVDSAHLDGSAFYYDSQLEDLHDRRPGISNGLPYFDLNDNGIRDANEPTVLQRVNVGSATIRGVELDARYRFSPAFSLAANFTRTRGEDHVLNEPLSRIPPDFGRLTVRWSPGAGQRRVWSELGYTLVAAQRRISTRDKGDARIGKTGTDGFDLFDARGGFDLPHQIRVSLAVENIFDTAYKYHASGVLRPGRQFVLGSEFRF